MSRSRLTRKGVGGKKFVEGVLLIDQAEEAFARERAQHPRGDMCDFAESHALYVKAAELLRAAKQRDPSDVSI
jgi:hypothetical protein